MGFFSAIGSAISAAVSTVSRVVSTVASKIPTIIMDGPGSRIPDIFELGKKIYDTLFGTSKEVGRTSSYDPDTASSVETENVNTILTKFSLNIKERADSLENDAIESVEDFFENILDQLDKADLQIGTKELRLNMRKSKQNLKGTFKKYIAKRVSLADHECLEILEMAPSAEKERKMETFSENVIDKGLELLADKISRIIEDNNKFLEEQFQQFSEQQEKDIQAVQKQLDEMLASAQGDLIDQELAKLKPIMTIANIKLVENALV